MEKKSGKGKAKEDMGFEGYGLRDNPKKSWKSLGFNGDDDHDDATTSSTLWNQCKVCDKQFESKKALFGHMRHHSTRGRKEVSCQECGKKFKSLRALTGHMRLHPLKSLTVKRKRSKRSRYNGNNGLNSSVSSLNESSGLVEIDQDIEEAALCLIMMSKGLRNWAEFISFWESCENNNDPEIKSFGFRHELDSYDKNKSECKESDSGILSEKKKDDESGFELYETEIEGRVPGERMNFKSIQVEPGEDLMEGLELTGLGSTKSSSCKYGMFDACESEPGRDVLNNLTSTPLNSEMSDDSQRKNKHKCRICSKTFKSHQALGGHQTIHRKGNACAVEPETVEDSEKTTHVSSSPEIEASCKRVKVEYVKNSVDQEMNEVTSPETRVHNKVHQCLVCLKFFGSGQALGGHKRSHISKDPGNGDKLPAKELDLSNISDVIDLNLPVMHNEEANGDTGLKSCRLRTNCNNEALPSLVAN